ncbi:hypothetical protein JXB22_11510 [candidate division WOR-3 bacterium]|nr:hypothetical protein [candidate division WOR-3 bacterium]
MENQYHRSCFALVITVFISLAGLKFIYGQIPDTLWTKTYGGTGDDWGYSVKQTSDGGFIVGGITQSYGSAYGYLLKTDQYGDTTWTKTYSDPIKSVLQTDDGGYIFSGGEMLGIMGHHIYATHTDSLENILWTRSFIPNYGSSRPGEIRPTLDSCYILIGTVIDTSWITPFRYIFLAKINNYGDTLWTKIYGDDDERGYSIDPTADGGYIGAGWWQGSCLFKFNAMGDVSWVMDYGGWTPYSVRQTSNTDFIRIGTVNVSNRNIYAVKADSAGDTIWIREYGGPYHDEGFCIREAADSYYIIAGYSRSYGNGSQDVYLLKIAENGDSLWARVYGGDSNDVAREIEVTSDGGYIVVGETRSYGSGGSDIWLLRLATDPGVQEHNTATPDRNGNWGATILTGPIQLPSDRTCKVFDITGRVVLPTQLKPGIFFVEVDGVIIHKVIKVK